MQADDRQESRAERLDRNWIELIQELRVAQTGVQVMAGFLLTLPFTNRFGVIDSGHRLTYLVAFSLATLTIGLMIAPVAMHRVLFGRHEKDVLVRAGDRFARTGLVAMGLTLVAVVVLIFGVVVGDAAGLIAGAVVLVLFTAAWIVVPLTLLERGDRRGEGLL